MPAIHNHSPGPDGHDETADLQRDAWASLGIVRVGPGHLARRVLPPARSGTLIRGTSQGSRLIRLTSWFVKALLVVVLGSAGGAAVWAWKRSRPATVATTPPVVIATPSACSELALPGGGSLVRLGAALVDEVALSRDALRQLGAMVTSASPGATVAHLSYPTNSGRLTVRLLLSPNGTRVRGLTAVHAPAVPVCQLWQALGVAERVTWESEPAQQFVRGRATNGAIWQGRRITTDTSEGVAVIRALEDPSTMKPARDRQ